MLSPARALRLKPLLDAFADERPWEKRIAADPVELVHRYSRPRDVEVVGLLAASLAYGRVDLFKPKIDALLSQMGKRPADFVAELEVPSAAKLLEGFVYRFNVAADLAVLLLGMGAALRSRGSLEAVFAQAAQARPSHAALAAFISEIRAGAPLSKIERRLGKTRGLAHMLPSPLGPGAAKRLNLYLRWMVRGPDPIDFGVWRSVSPASLLMPMDTHTGRVARLLGLTERRDLSWKTAEEVTASLRQLDPRDPVRYDFALCHYGMSGACPATPVRANCVKCPLKSECRVGRSLKHLGSE